VYNDTNKLALIDLVATTLKSCFKKSTIIAKLSVSSSCSPRSHFLACTRAGSLVQKTHFSESSSAAHLSASQIDYSE
jgi:hypothetical protein